MESWTPGPNSITCPKCGKEGHPIVKKQKNKLAKSPLGALCMLGYVAKNSFRPLYLKKRTRT